MIVFIYFIYIIPVEIQLTISPYVITVLKRHKKLNRFELLFFLHAIILFDYLLRFLVSLAFADLCVGKKEKIIIFFIYFLSFRFWFFCH